MEETINAFFQEFASHEPGKEGEVGFYQFCCFMKHCKLLSSTFDHSHALQVFKRVAAEEFGTQDDDGSLSVGFDLRAFRRALEVICEMLYGNPRLIDRLLQDIGVRREGVFDPGNIGETQDLLYNHEVIDAVYGYSMPLRELFLHYATSSSSGTNKDEAAVTWKAVVGRPHEFAVQARSFYRLCRACGIVPGVVVPAELLELARDLHFEKGSRPKQEAWRYFEDEKMISGGDLQNWQTPVTSSVSGEPKYNFPRFVECLAAIALCSPPPVHQEEVGEQVSRVHEIFRGFLGLPTDSEFPSGWTAVRAFRATGGVQGGSGEPIASDVASAGTLIGLLENELPLLPKPPELVLSNPGLDETMLPPPPTVEEKITELLAAKDKKKKKRKDDDADAGGNSRINWGEITYFAKRPDPQEPLIPPEFRRERRGEEWTRFDNAQLARSRTYNSGGPSGGKPVGQTLRASLIDEPLLPPVCPESGGEVTTLIESATASRRLRDYDVAVMLLLQAREEWVRTVNSSTKGSTKDSDWIPPPEGRVSMSLTLASDLDSQMRVPGDGGDADPSVSSTDRLLCKTKPAPREAPFGDSGMSSARSGMLPSGSGKQMLTERLYEPEIDFARRFGLETSGKKVSEDALPLEVNLFFYCEFASLHSALRQDELALRLLWRAKRYSDALPLAHPDTACVWSCIGRVAFHMGFHESAARAFLKVQQIRERTIGGNSVEAATAYHNVAVAFMELSRNREATAYLTLASALFDLLLGDSHPRTLTCRRNLAKAKASKMNMRVEVPHLFYKSFQDLYPEGGKKKKGGGKKKKK